MNWKFDPKTGGMKPHENPSTTIDKSMRPTRDVSNLRIVSTPRDGAKILTDDSYQYLAICFRGQWRLLGVITNMNAIMQKLRGPLVDFHNAWLRGEPININELK